MVLAVAKIADVELRMENLELTSYDGTLVWKITDLRKKREDAVSGRAPIVYSPSFYTSKTGLYDVQK